MFMALTDQTASSVALNKQSWCLNSKTEKRLSKLVKPRCPCCYHVRGQEMTKTKSSMLADGQLCVRHDGFYENLMSDWRFWIEQDAWSIAGQVLRWRKVWRSERVVYRGEDFKKTWPRRLMSKETWCLHNFWCEETRAEGILSQVARAKVTNDPKTPALRTSRKQKKTNFSSRFIYSRKSSRIS